jgi:para-aminobenzoate synthetase/4-amino-4-deoxychorismate lyase
MLLLDDAESSRDQPTSRLYQEPKQTWRVDRVSELKDCFSGIEAALAAGDFVVALFAYELGYHFQKIVCKYPEPMPLVRAWSFAKVEKYSKEEVDTFLTNALGTSQSLAGVMNLHDSLDETRFIQDIDTISEWIRNGDTYQINHSYRITGTAYGSPLALYARLRARQPGRYGALIEDGDHYVLSQSPELFIRRTGNTLTAMPMKGTADASSVQANELASDPKNQAENVMIVDLLRNDLGQLAVAGSVNVPSLFEVRQHGQVLQMTSTVQAKALPNLPIAEILRAIFPCGSVTGAPKKRSMEIIQELEDQPRTWYCGALGWFDPDGDFAMSVPIRTLQMQYDAKAKASQFMMGVGAGITIDSHASPEYQECQIKAAFLTALPSEMGLFETILLTPGHDHIRIALQTEHLVRLANSAKALGIAFDAHNAAALLESASKTLAHDRPYRVRLDLSVAGVLSITSALLEPLPTPVQIFWAHEILRSDYSSDQLIMNSQNPLLCHKVIDRPIYDAAWQKASALGGFDALFINEHGYVTEGGRSSIFVRHPNTPEWLTPPLSAGVLPGVMRAAILNNPTIKAREANLTIHDVISANEIMLTNALRGIIPAHL